jgi:hypothetical protein
MLIERKNKESEDATPDKRDKEVAKMPGPRR